MGLMECEMLKEAVSCCVPFAAEATLILSIRSKLHCGDSNLVLISILAMADETSGFYWKIITQISLEHLF